MMGYAIPAAAALNDFKTLELKMDSLDAEVLFRKEPTDTSSFPVAVVENGAEIPGRVEVLGKFTRNFLKKSLLIKLDEGHTWHGKRRISLRSMSTDLSYMRESLAWDMAASIGTVSPKVEYVRMNINGKFIGIFLYIEWIDQPMFERFGLGRDGEFFQPDDSVYCGDMSPANQNRLEECWLKLAPRDKNYASLRKLIEGINSAPVEQFDSFLSQNFDVDSVINWLALNTVTGNGDTYNKNYFIYLSKKTGKWVVMPWDFDLSFGRNADPVLPFPRNILNNNYQYFYPPELGSSNPLKEKTLKNAQLFQRFKKRISHVLGVTKESDGQGGFAWFKPGEFSSRVSGLKEIIGKELSKELYPGAKGAPFQEQVDALLLYNQWRHPLLKKMILDPTPFNTAHWLPYTAFPPLTTEDTGTAQRRQFVPLNLSVTADVRPGDTKVVMTEELLARPIGMLSVRNISKTARVRLEVETERTPVLLPPGIDPRNCIQRTWFVDVKTPDAELTVDLEFDYLQESSLRHEIGEGITDEHGLSLWSTRGGAWQKLPTRVNSISNVLNVEGIQLIPSQLTTFVACGM